MNLTCPSCHQDAKETLVNFQGVEYQCECGPEGKIVFHYIVSNELKIKSMNIWYDFGHNHLHYNYYGNTEVWEIIAGNDVTGSVGGTVLMSGKGLEPLEDIMLTLKRLSKLMAFS